LRLMALAGRAAEESDQLLSTVADAPSSRSYIEEIPTLRPDPPAMTAPWHRVAPEVGQILVALHDVAVEFLPQALKARARVQGLRRRADGEIADRLGVAPLDAVEAVFSDLGRRAVGR
jgi:hypothetical protein